MDGQVLEHQAEGGRGILQIVDKERGHGLKSFKFAGLQKFLGQKDIAQPGGHLIANAFEQVKILLGKRHAADAITQNHQAKNVARNGDRDANAAAAFVELVGVAAAENRRPFFGRGINIGRLRIFLKGQDDFLCVVAPGG